MTAPALRRIATELDKLAAEAPDELAHDLRVIARKVGAQAEMVEQGLGE